MAVAVGVQSYSKNNISRAYICIDFNGIYRLIYNMLGLESKKILMLNVEFLYDIS
uniref:Uncharacterized protein n=1 Tax=Romanomermis culicivorax TaxID=13658 RepID=A0A915IPF1_ROMCU